MIVEILSRKVVEHHQPWAMASVGANADMEDGRIGMGVWCVSVHSWIGKSRLLLATDRRQQWSARALILFFFFFKRYDSLYVYANATPRIHVVLGVEW